VKTSARIPAIVFTAIVNAEPTAVESVKWNAPNHAVAGHGRVTFRLQPGLRVE
jgi:hypothetical protein